MNSNSTLNRDLRSYFHRRLYLGLQVMRGRPVGFFMRQKQKIEELDHERYRNITQYHLEKAIEYARNYVPLYSTNDWAKSLSTDNFKDIRCWPVLERDTVGLFLKNYSLEQNQVGFPIEKAPPLPLPPTPYGLHGTRLLLPGIGLQNTSLCSGTGWTGRLSS